MPSLDLIKCSTATTGTGTVTIGATDTGYRSFLGNVTNGAKVSYGIEDGADHETGWGIWNSGAQTLTRNVIASSQSDALLNLTGSAKIYVDFISRDIDAIIARIDANEFSFLEMMRFIVEARAEAAQAPYFIADDFATQTYIDAAASTNEVFDATNRLYYANYTPADMSLAPVSVGKTGMTPQTAGKNITNVVWTGTHYVGVVKNGGGGSNNIWRSSDGIAWSIVGPTYWDGDKVFVTTNGLGSVVVWSAAGFPSYSTAQRASFSNDHGATWSTPASSIQNNILFTDWDGTGYVSVNASATPAVNRHSNTGAALTVPSNPPNTPGTAMEFVANPSNGNMAIVGGSATYSTGMSCVQYSLDAGVTWLYPTVGMGTIPATAPLSALRIKRPGFNGFYIRFATGWCRYDLSNPTVLYGTNQTDTASMGTDVFTDILCMEDITVLMRATDPWKVQNSPTPGGAAFTTYATPPDTSLFTGVFNPTGGKAFYYDTTDVTVAYRVTRGVEAYTAMDLRSNLPPTPDVPIAGRMLILAKKGTGISAPTPNTDIKGRISRDGMTTLTQANLRQLSFTGGWALFESDELSLTVQPSASLPDYSVLTAADTRYYIGAVALLLRAI